MEAFGIEAILTEIEADIAFHYFHPLSTAELSPEDIGPHSPLNVAGQSVLRFGFVEGDAVVDGGRVVYDPQHWRDALSFRDNGSTASALAIVLNEGELERSMGLEGDAGARALLNRVDAQVVVVKRGPLGAIVFDGKTFTNIPAYQSDTVFKIGSGDVFSAVFAHFWTEKGISAAEAADIASRSVARYVNSRNVEVASDAEPNGLAIRHYESPGLIYLASPFFSLGQRWIVEEARRLLLAFGASVFSPLHEVGVVGSAAEIAQNDLAGLRQASSVLAIIDGEDAGTIFEIGYARQLDIPVVALAEATRAETLTMISGSGCRVTHDFCSAVYHAVWASMR